MNYTTTPIENLAQAMAHALYEGFSDLVYKDRDWSNYRRGGPEVYVEKVRRPTTYEATVVAMFPQTWGSTSLGFGGVGGQAITSAYTIVIEYSGEYCVYFGGRFAYRVEQPNTTFFEDIAARSLAKVSDSTRYRR